MPSGTVRGDGIRSEQSRIMGETPCDEPVHALALDTWTPPAVAETGAALARELENGRVLYFPSLGFAFRERELRFLSPHWSSGHSKNISIDGEGARLKGAAGPQHDVAELGALVMRFRTQAADLIRRLFPAYAPHLRLARTSYRPMRVENRASSWRKDDSRLHVDAFPSRPNRGERILRVFANVDPHGEPRVWRLGEPFEDVAKRLLPHIRRPLPGSAWLLAALSITKSLRSEYDHLMLGLHDRMKGDPDYQRNARHATVSFAAGSVWICFSDQVAHAAMSGQFMLEQTLHLPVHALYEPASSPLCALERLTSRALI